MIDEKQIVYSKESLVDIVTDNTTSTLGTVDISGGQITLGPKSSVSYEYTYEAGQDISIITDILQLDCSVVGLTQGMNTRYNRYLNIEIKVQYYLEIVENGKKTYYDGNIDTFEIYPYLSHESNNTLYNIALQNSYIKKINITYKNDYESDSVKYTDIKLKYSMSLLEAINKYGGGSTYVPGSNSLKFYSVDDKYSIDSCGDSLIMKIDIDENNWEEVIKPYIKCEETTYTRYTIYYDSDGLAWNFVISNKVQSYTAKVRWTVRSKSNNTSAFSTMVYGDEQIVYVKEARDLSYEEKERLRSVTGSEYDREYNRILNSGDACFEMKVNLEGRYCKIVGYQTDTLIVRAEYIDAPNIYFEKEVKINNCSVVGFKFNFDDNDMEIHGSDIQFATIDIIPSNIKNRDSNYNMVELSCMTYTENGEPGGRAVFVNDNGSYSNSIGFRILPAQLKIKGINNGKVLFTAKTVNLYPAGFSKSWIAEVSDVEDIKIWIDGPDVITSNTDVYNYTIKNSQGLNMHIGGVTSNWSYESIDGGSIEYTTIQYCLSAKELGFSIRANTNGKIVLKIILEIVNTGVSYTITKEVNINIEGLVETTEITTNTGLFEITQGGGQLEVYCTPNYNNAGGYSFSQVSIDGGSVSINDKGNYALITADKEGRLNLICTPTYGPSASCEITVSNQYPEEVNLTCADNIFKVPINGNLMIYAEPTNKPNSNFNKYNWQAEKLDADGNCSFNYWDTNIKLTGTALGKVRISCNRKVDSKYMASQVIKIVQSLDSDKTVLPLPDGAKYWVVYRRTDQSNRLWLAIILDDITLDKLTFTSENKLNTDVNTTSIKQYRIENGQWYQHGSWTTSNTNICSSVGQLYASNIDIYDESGNLLIAKTDNYDDVDFDKIIYG